MKKLSFMTLMMLIVANSSVLFAKSGDESDTKHPYHPIVQDAKLIASFAKIWWITEKMKKHAEGDPEQQQILTIIQENAHDMKEMVIQALTKRIQEQSGKLKSDAIEEIEEIVID